MPAPESPTVTGESILNDPSRSEFASLPDTTAYYEAWLKSLNPSSKPADDQSSAIRFEGTLRIDCYISSVVHSRTGTLTVGETAELQANIFVATAIIDGLVRGDVRATERVELGSTARVIGDIETPALAIQPGAVFEGQCHFLSPPSKSGAAKKVRSSVRKSTVSRRSRRSPADPDSEEKQEAISAVAAGR